MPKVVRFYVIGDKAYSATTFRELKGMPLQSQIADGSYVQVNAPADYKVSRKIAGRAKREIQKEDQIRDFRQAMGPNYLENIPTKTLRGTDRKPVGAGKDSFLRALNRSYAILNGIPLNEANRKVLNKVYAREVAAAKAVAGRTLEVADWAGDRKKYWDKAYELPDKPKRGDQARVNRSNAALARRKKIFSGVVPLDDTKNPFA